MIIEKTGFDGLLLIHSTIFTDSRGFFTESYNQRDYARNGLSNVYVQDNLSFSTKYVIRGLHFQAPPFAQEKLVRVIDGAVKDVVVDLRTNHPTYGRVFSIELSSENQKQLLIPKGFAHGFSVLSDTATLFYKCSEFHNSEAETGIYFNDPQLNIDWGIPTDLAIVSKKDLGLPLISESYGYF